MAHDHGDVKVAVEEVEPCKRKLAVEAPAYVVQQEWSNISSSCVSTFFSGKPDITIWRSTNVPCTGNSCPGWTMLDNNGATVQIEAASSGLYQRHGNGRIWRSTGAACSGNSCPGWVMLDNNPTTSTIVTAQP